MLASCALEDSWAPSGNVLPGSHVTSVTRQAYSCCTVLQVIFDGVLLEARSEACTPDKVAAWAQQLVAALKLRPGALSYNSTAASFNSVEFPVPIFKSGSNATGAPQGWVAAGEKTVLLLLRKIKSNRVAIYTHNFLSY